ncbi:MAG: hypothetical protein ACXVB1_02590 [Pseudobdellovibrionaceae bacterium]
MLLMKNIKTYLYIVVAAFAISACAKRDSEFAARKNAAGAAYVNDQQAAAADQAAAATGYVTDILQIQSPVQTSTGALSVTSQIKVNNNVYQIVTTHSQVNTASSTSTMFAGANFEVAGICGSDICNPYYLVINITRNGQRIKQTAMKKYFYYVDQNSTQDLIISLGANEFMSIESLRATLDQAVVNTGN